MGEEAAWAASLLRLYGVMLRLGLIAETSSLGSVARAAREAQQELWPVIAHLGGSREEFGRWQAERQAPARRARGAG